MSPAEEAAYLRALADEIATDPHLGRIARTTAAAIIDGRAQRIEQRTTA